MFSKRINKTRRRIELHLVALAASLIASAALAGCATDEGFPKSVPQSGYEAWVDPPLQRTLRGELSQTREVLVGFLQRR